jgi:DICT domain-containing protein
VTGRPAVGIAEVAARTGIGVPVLRAWESRFGFPSPARLPSGRRAYSERDVELLRQVVRDRAGGLSLRAAVERAAASPARPAGSIHAGLRARRADLDVWLLSKRMLLDMSHAIEDEYCARGEPAVLIATFQREEFYRRAERRWRDLARTAELAVVLADFDRPRQPRGGPVEIPLEASEPINREWTLVCDGPGFSACLAGWERAGQEAEPDAERQFETLWSVEAPIVREAARTARAIAVRAAPDLAARFPARLDRTPPPAAPEVRTLVALTGRMIGYAERSGDSAPAAAGPSSTSVASRR